MVRSLPARRQPLEEVAISDRHLEILNIIEELIERMNGISPTLTEVAVRAQISKQRTAQIYTILKTHGYIEFEPWKNRSVKILKTVEEIK